MIEPVTPELAGMSDTAPPKASTATARRRRRPLRTLALPLTIISLYVMIAILGPLVLPYDPQSTNVGDRLLAPGTVTSSGSVAVLGTDQVGRDLLAQIVEGARVSLVVGALSLLLAGVIGTLLGIAAGYFGGIVDTVIMRVADIQLAFPSILLAVFIAAVLGPSVTNVIATLAITNWPAFARLARGQTLATRDRDYVNAARTLGATDGYIIRHSVLPVVLSPVLVVATVQFGLVIVAESSLSFLGLGVPTSTASWGATIANGRDYLDTAWWISAMPGIALVVLVTAAGILGDRVRDILDPRSTTR